MGKLEVYTADGRKKLDTGSGGGGVTLPIDAEDVDVADAGGYFTGTELETILQELGADAVEGSSTTLGGGAFRNSIRNGDQVWAYSDFLGLPSVLANATTILGNDFVARTVGTNSALNGDATEVDAANVLGHEHPGVAVLSPGTTTTGVCTVACGHFGGSASTLGGSIIFGTGKVRMGVWLYLPILSNTAGGQAFNIRAGFFDRDNAAISNGAYFRYKDDVNGGRWEFVREVATVETAADTGFAAVAATTWYYLEVEISADGETATFYINGTSVGSVSDIAEGTTAPQFAGVHVAKVSGTTRRFLYVDAMYLTMGVNR